MKTRLWTAALASVAGALASLGAGAAVVTGAAGCLPMGCTLIAAWEGAILHINLPAPSGTSPLRLEIEAEGDTLAFEVVHQDGSFRCQNGCEARGVNITVEESFGITPALDVVVGHVDRDGGPAHIIVRVIDGAVTRSAEISPRYETVEINGRGCGKNHQAELDVTPM